MPNRELFDNIGELINFWKEKNIFFKDSVMLFAFCGTIWNTLTIGQRVIE